MYTMTFTAGGLFFSLAFFLCSLPLGNGELQLQNETLQQLVISEDIGYALYKAYRSTMGGMSERDISALKKNLPQFKSTSYLACYSTLAALKKDPQKMAMYLDAAGKPRSGYARANSLWMGSFSECQDISDSHYCLSTIRLSIFPPNSPNVTWGACFPKVCNTIDVNMLMASIIPKVNTAIKKANMTIEYYGTLCPENVPSYTTGVKVTLVFCGILLLLCLIGTIIDLVIEAYNESIAVTSPPCFSDIRRQDEFAFGHQTENDVNGHSSSVNSDDLIFLVPPQKSYSHNMRIMALKDSFKDFFLCFSLVRNTKRIFNTNVPPVAITSINGIRVISITWVILGHTYLLFVLFSPFTENKVGALYHDSQLLSIMPVINGYYSVDSFFFLSGLLVAYTCFRKLKKSEGKFNWFLFYFHRFWRLTPLYMFVILFDVQLKRFLSDGPLWYSMYEDKLCTEHWWTNLLYINNFYPKEFDDECIAWSWYLANDMQFFVITPPLLIVIYKWGWRGLLFPLTLLLQSSVVIAVLYGYYDLDPLGSLKIAWPQSPERAKKSNDYSNYIYSKPYCRIQPYLVGFILGYIIHKNYSRLQRPGWIVTLVGWAAAFAVGMALVYGPHKSIIIGAEEWTTTENILYGTFERLLWGLALAWVTYACHYNSGGLVQKFLSARFWIPLSRLTYSVYLIHLIVLMVMAIGAKGTVHYDYYTTAYYFISAVVLSYGAAFILAVTIEFPCDNLENMALKYLNRCWKSGNV